MKLPQITLELLNPQLEQDIDQELWQPDWKCFCCHDTGLILEHLVRRLAPEYDGTKHKRVVCQNSGCEAGDTHCTCCHNHQVLPSICQDLDKQERQDWRETLFKQSKQMQERSLDLAAIAKAKTMPGSRGRNANDDREIEIHKDNAENMPLPALSGNLDF